MTTYIFSHFGFVEYFLQKKNSEISKIWTKSFRDLYFRSSVRVYLKFTFHTSFERIKYVGLIFFFTLRTRKQ